MGSILSYLTASIDQMWISSPTLLHRAPARGRLTESCIGAEADTEKLAADDGKRGSFRPDSEKVSATKSTLPPKDSNNATPKDSNRQINQLAQVRLDVGALQRIK
jgi:hypothetical protein